MASKYANKWLREGGRPGLEAGQWSFERGDPRREQEGSDWSGNDRAVKAFQSVVLSMQRRLPVWIVDT